MRYLRPLLSAARSTVIPSRSQSLRVLRSVVTLPVQLQGPMASSMQQQQPYSGLSKSQRTPQFSTNNNDADHIERYLRQDAHQVWGVVVYRCTYEDDDKWRRGMELLQAAARQSMEFYNGLDLWDNLRITVIEDKATFDGASTATVRQHFQEWCNTAVQQEQGHGAIAGLAYRYQYCIQIDKAALESVLEDDISDSYVNLIYKDWEPTDDIENDDGGEEIEGCTLYDVGWMRVNYHAAVVGFMTYLRDAPGGDWEREYRRPPEVAQT